MNGNRYLLDTNAIVSLLKGNPAIDKIIVDSEWIGISVISQLEFLAFPSLDKNDEKIFNKFINRINVISLDRNNKELIKQIIVIRKNYKLKLPDSIIVSTAIQTNANLITADKDLLKINEIKVIAY